VSWGNLNDMLDHDSVITITRNSNNNKAIIGLTLNDSTRDVTCKDITCKDIQIVNGILKFGASPYLIFLG